MLLKGISLLLQDSVALSFFDSIEYTNCVNRTIYSHVFDKDEIDKENDVLYVIESCFQDVIELLKSKKVLVVIRSLDEIKNPDHYYCFYDKSEISLCIKNLINGRYLIPDKIYSALIHSFVSNKTIEVNKNPGLTDRENDILNLLNKGLSNKEIAKHSGLSIFTVKNHLHTIFSKLGVEDRTQAVLATNKNEQNN